MAAQLAPIPEYSDRDDEESIISIVTASSSNDTNQSLPSSPNTSIGGLFPNSPSSSSFGGNLTKESSPKDAEAASVDPYKWISDPEYLPGDVEFVNGEMVGATVEALVERLTSLEDPVFTAAFLLTFRLYCSPLKLAKLLDARYKVRPLPQTVEMEEQTGSEVRQGTLKFTFTWLKEFWQPGVDDPAFPALTMITSRFLSDDMSNHTKQALTFPVFNLLNLRIQGELETPGTKIQRRPHALGFVTDAAPKRRITRALLKSLRDRDFTGIFFINFDALELARQLTLMESKLYCAISQEELLNHARDKPNLPQSINAFESFGEIVRHWVSESILHELNVQRRAWLIGFFIKIADVSLILCESMTDFRLNICMLEEMHEA